MRPDPAFLETEPARSDPTLPGMESRASGASAARDEWSRGRGQGGCVSSHKQTAAQAHAGQQQAQTGGGARKGAAQAVWAGGTRQRRTKKGKKLLFA